MLLEILSSNKMLFIVLQVGQSGASSNPDLNKRIQDLEKENVALKKVTDELRALVLSLDSRVKAMEGSKPVIPAKAASAPAPAKPAAKDDDDDDDVDLFGKIKQIYYHTLNDVTYNS